MHGSSEPNANVLFMFLEMFGVRVICAPCLARLTEERAVTVATWLETQVAQGDVSRGKKPCLNCEAVATVYSLPHLT